MPISAGAPGRSLAIEMPPTLGHARPPQVDRARRARPAAGSRAAASATGTRAPARPRGSRSGRGRGPSGRCSSVRGAASIDDVATGGDRTTGRSDPRCYHRAPCSIATSSSEVLVAARRKGGDVAEVFVEERSSTSVRLDDGRVEELTTGLDRGAGVRVLPGHDLRLRLREPARPALAARGGGCGERRAGRRCAGSRRRSDRAHRAGDEPRRARGRATSTLRRRSAGSATVDEVARGVSPEVAQVTGIYFDSMQRRLIATSDGRWVREDRPRIRVVAQVVAKRGDVIQTGWHGPAACAGVEFLDVHPPERDRTSRGRARGRDAGLDPRAGRRDGRSSSPTDAAVCCSTRRSGTRSRPTPSTRRHPSTAACIGEQCSSELINGVDDATIRQRLGLLRLRRRGHAGRAHRAVHRRRARRVPAGPDARGADGRRRPRATPGASPTRTRRSCA